MALQGCPFLLLPMDTTWTKFLVVLRGQSPFCFLILSHIVSVASIRLVVNLIPLSSLTYGVCLLFHACLAVYFLTTAPLPPHPPPSTPPPEWGWSYPYVPDTPVVCLGTLTFLPLPSYLSVPYMRFPMEHHSSRLPSSWLSMFACT